MKEIVSLTALVSVLAALMLPNAAFARDFRAEYDGLVRGFNQALFDAEKAQDQVNRADALYESIKSYRQENRDKLDKAENKALRDFAKEVRRFRSVAKVVGQVKNSATVTIESFDAVSESLNLQVQPLQSEASGVEVVQVKAGQFRSLLLRNTSSNNYSVIYSTNQPDKPGGVGVLMCKSLAVMSGLYNSRDTAFDGIKFEIQALDTKTKCR